MVQWLVLYGVFCYDDDELCLIEGVKVVLNGEQMVELSVMYLVMYVVDYVLILVENLLLIEWECEIFNELCCGVMNLDIVCVLFISENMVWMYLYNVFCKLSVKNCIQVVSWVNEYLCY